MRIMENIFFIFDLNIFFIIIQNLKCLNIMNKLLICDTISKKISYKNLSVY